MEEFDFYALLDKLNILYGCQGYPSNSLNEFVEIKGQNWVDLALQKYYDEYYNENYLLQVHNQSKEQLQSKINAFLLANFTFSVEQFNEIWSNSEIEFGIAKNISKDLFEKTLENERYIFRENSYRKQPTTAEIDTFLLSKLDKREIKSIDIENAIEYANISRQYAINSVRNFLKNNSYLTNSGDSVDKIEDLSTKDWRKYKSKDQLIEEIELCLSKNFIQGDKIKELVSSSVLLKEEAVEIFRKKLTTLNYKTKIGLSPIDVVDIWGYDWELKKAEELKSSTTEDVKNIEKKRIEYIPQPIKDPNPSKSKMLVPVILLGLVGLAVFYFAWLKTYLEEKDLPHFYSLATDVVIRSSPENYNNNNIISEMLPFGAEVRVFPETSGDFTKVRLENPAIRGYMATKYLISKEDFDIVKKLFPNPDALSAVDKFIYRKALLDFLKNTNSAAMNWTLRNPVAQSNKKMVYPNAVEYRDAKGKLIYEKVDEAKYFSVYISSTSSSTTKRVNFTVENKKEVYFVSESYGETE